jgi:formylglycine-generating enzyme required for sulfatase activity
MYCEGCDIEFPEGLRYCKWCGRVLLPSRSDLSASEVCPGCGGATQPDWVYCRSCGARLQSASARVCRLCGETVSPLARNCPRCGEDLAKSGRATTAMTPPGEFCPVCGCWLSSGLKYCKGCGSAIASNQYVQHSDPEHSSIFCAVCHSQNSPGSSACRVCGAVFTTAPEKLNPTLWSETASEDARAGVDLITSDPNASSHQASTSAITKARDTSPIESEQTEVINLPVMAIEPQPATQTADDLAGLAELPTDARTSGSLAVTETTEAQTGYFVPEDEQSKALSLYDPEVALTPTQMEAVVARKSSVGIALGAALLVIVTIVAYLGWRFVLARRGGLTASRVEAPVTRLSLPGATNSTQVTSAPTESPAPPEDMVLIEAGNYYIGRDDGDIYARPKHIVTLSAFYIDRTEVTNAEYKKFIDATGHKAPAGWINDNYPQGQDRMPVTGVSWQDAADYAAWVGKRLPTEAEWEAAARGADGRIYPWGNQWRSDLANIGTTGIVEVGRYKGGASPAGALDMIGNVWEWTADEFKLYPGSTAPMPASIKPGRTFRVIRGGAYDGNQMHDATYRGFVDASRGYDKTGFRCAKSANLTQ